VEDQKILAVDDRPENLIALRKTLADSGAQIIEAQDGQAALAATLTHEFSLAILDVQMPAMDGYELAELLRGDPKTRYLPIMFLTAAYGHETQVFKGYESGAVDYIVKPYDPAILRTKVGIFLELDRNRRQLRAHRDELDRRVAERTAELERANRQLSDEVAERKRIEQGLQLTVAELQKTNADLEKYAYVASHDLQEPLRMVVSYTQLLERRYAGQLDGQADEYIRFAVEGALRMQTLIEGVLELSRLGERSLCPDRTNCEALIQSVRRALRKEIEEAGALIEVSDLPTLQADPIQLARVFVSLLDNAVKFRSAEQPRIAVSARRAAQAWEFCVADNGIGIEAEFQSQVFAMFKRLHPRQRYAGTGIGLAVVEKIVAAHGGQVWVESEAGKGSRFFFAIPDEPAPLRSEFLPDARSRETGHVGARE